MTDMEILEKWKAEEKELVVTKVREPHGFFLTATRDELLRLIAAARTTKTEWIEFGKTFGEMPKKALIDGVVVVVGTVDSWGYRDRPTAMVLGEANLLGGGCDDCQAIRDSDIIHRYTHDLVPLFNAIAKEVEDGNGK